MLQAFILLSRESKAEGERKNESQKGQSFVRRLPQNENTSSIWTCFPLVEMRGIEPKIINILCVLSYKYRCIYAVFLLTRTMYIYFEYYRLV